MSKKKSFPIFTIIFLIFLTLKLAEIGQVAAWSWWWITAPLWLPLTVGLLVIGLTITVGVIIAYINSKL
jgi:hypothetical protein